MGLKTFQNSSFRGLKKKAHRFVLSYVMTKSGFVTTELLLTLLRQNLVFSPDNFVTGSVTTKFGFVWRDKVCC